MRTAGDRVLTADVVTTPDGRSRGYGLVTFVTPREAAHAAASLSESELHGRKIFVREDRDGGRSDQKSAPQTDGNGRNSYAANCKVYVGNLAWDVSWQDLKDHMRTAGGRVVTADVAMESGDNNRSKGFGLVTFASAPEAEEAITRLNDSDLKGRKIFVREDREGGAIHHQDNNRHHNDAEHRGRGVHQQQHQQQEVVEDVPSATVYVGNLAWDVAGQDLEEHMKRGGGQVVKAEVLREGESGRSKGCALVEFGSVDEASHAISVLNETELNGRKIFVRFDREQAGNRGDAKPFVQHGVEFKLFVGQLAWAVRWQELKDHFKQAGLAVTHADVQREVRGDDNSRSRGFGFVSFETREEAERAVTVLHGSTLLDRQIVVREDQAPQQEHRN
eukprot:gene36240-44703_t